MIHEGFTLNHPTVPKGWKAREKYFGKVKLLEVISPEGKLFKGKRAALAHMIEENYPESKIEELRQSLEKDGWMKHEKLPENWLYKKYKKGLNTCKMTVITSKGILIKSKDLIRANQSVC